MKARLFRLWRFLLPFFFIFFLIHFLKDITQDILVIRTPLDILGDVKEDLSFLPPISQKIYLYGLRGLSFITEAFILYTIPVVWKKKEARISMLEKWLIAAVLYLFLFFAIAISLSDLL